MARFDVCGLGGGLVVDVQSDLLAHLDTRVVAPLVPLDQAPRPARRLNPRFDVAGDEVVMLTQFLAAVEARHLGPPVASLAKHSFIITDALDVLISGV